MFMKILKMTKYKQKNKTKYYHYNLQRNSLTRLFFHSFTLIRKDSGND